MPSRRIAVNWKAIERTIEELNPHLHQSISQLPKNTLPPIYKSTYEYGNDLSQGNGQNYPEDTVLVLSGALEIYLALPDRSRRLSGKSRLPESRIAPYRIIRPGETFNWLDLLTPLNTVCVEPRWEMTAGARSLFMLHKIGDMVSHSNLRRRLRVENGKMENPPANYVDHWANFRDLYHHVKETQALWETTVLYFPKEWDEILPVSLSRSIGKNREIHRSYMAVQNTLNAIQNIENEKPEPYYDYLCQQILLVGAGLLPGFVAATDNSVAPVELIQESYEAYYRPLHAPVVMIPSLLDKHPVYLSFSHHSHLDAVAPSSSRDVNMESIRIRKVQKRWEFYKRHLSNLDCFDVEFYSSSADDNSLTLSNDILKRDAGINRTQAQYNKPVKQGHFFQCGVVITPKKACSPPPFQVPKPYAPI